MQLYNSYKTMNKDISMTKQINYKQTKSFVTTLIKPFNYHIQNEYLSLFATFIQTGFSKSVTLTYEPSNQL